MKKVGFILIATFWSLTATTQEQKPLIEKYREMALHYNHDLRAAEKNISASIELEKSARADLKPKLSGAAEFQYTGNPMELNLNLPTSSEGSVPLTFQGKNIHYGGSLTLLQPIYTGGQVLESIRMAGHHTSMAKGQAEVVHAAVCYQTEVQYWNAVARQEIVRVAEEFHASIASLVQTIRERVEAGLTDPQDLLMAEVKLNEAEYALMQARTRFETGRMALNSLIGLPLEELTEIEQTLPSVNAGMDFSTDGSERPELRMAADRIRMAESTRKLNDARFRPKFYVGVDGSYSSPGYNFKSDLDPNYAIYGKLSVPLFEWGKRRNEKRAGKLQISMATDNLNRVQDDIRLEVETARISLEQAMEQTQLTGSSLGKARANEQKALERYAEGRTSILEVIDAQTYRQTAQVNDVEARAAVQLEYTNLKKATHQF